jgi:hypothetical protein
VLVSRNVFRCINEHRCSNESWWISSSSHSISYY